MRRASESPGCFLLFGGHGGWIWDVQPRPPVLDRRGVTVQNAADPCNSCPWVLRYRNGIRYHFTQMKGVSPHFPALWLCSVMFWGKSSPRERKAGRIAGPTGGFPLSCLTKKPK